MSVLRTLIEQHNYTFSAAISKLRVTVEAETDEAANMNTINPVGVAICAIGAIGSLTNPLGLFAGSIGVVINAISLVKHRKDYSDLRYEVELIKAAPRLPDILNQYYQTEMLGESSLIAIYDRLVDSFSPQHRECLLESYSPDTGEPFADFVHPEEALKQYAHQAILSEDPNFKLAGIPTGIEEFNSRLEQIRASHAANVARRKIGLPMPPQAPPLPQSPIGINTRLGAVEATAQSLDRSPVAVLNRAFNSEEPIGLPPELMQSMVETPYSVFVIGQSGGGKDILVYNTMSEIRKRHPQACIIGIDGKNALTERPLWDKSIYNETIHFSMGDHPKTYHSKLMEIFNAIDQLPPMTFIVFSELNGTRDSYMSNGMGEQWNEVANKIRYIALQLNYAQKFLIATAQTANKVELGIGDGRQNVHFCLVSNGQQQSFIYAVSKASVFEGNAVKDIPTWQSCISRSNAVAHLPNGVQLGGVAYFHSALGRWLPMPRLQNPGSDRGVQSPTSQNEPQNAVSTPVPEIVLENSSSNELEESADKGNIEKPDLPTKDMWLACALLAEWIEDNPGLSFGQMYANYNARRKGFSRPQFRYLLTKIEMPDS